MDYNSHYALIERLEKEGKFIPAPVLWNFDKELAFDESLNSIAQPLANGQQSAFSSRNPLDGQGVLLSHVFHYIDLAAHEFNLTPDLAWLQHFRMLGASLQRAEYPILELEIHRFSPQGATFLPAATIPLGTRLYSSREQGLECILQDNAEFGVKQEVAIAKGRLNRLGELHRSLGQNEFELLDRWLISEIRVRSILHAGRDTETLPEMMLRVRERLQYGDRLVLARDFHRYAKTLGVDRAAILPTLRIDPQGGRWSDLLSIAIYPGRLAKILEPKIRERAIAGMRVVCEPAEIIPVVGNISIRTVPGVSDRWNLAAKAIQEDINPPNGKWGDRDFRLSLATALENRPNSFYAVPEMNLFNKNTRERIENMKVYPWMLFEIQKEIELKFI